jgi:hypothetical protein
LTASTEQWLVRLETLKVLVRFILGYLEKELHEDTVWIDTPDVMSIAKNGDRVNLVHLVLLVLRCAVQSPNNHVYVEPILLLDASIQATLKTIIETVIPVHDKTARTGAVSPDK